MALTAAVTCDAGLRDQLQVALSAGLHDLLVAPGLAAARRTVRERPVSSVIIDSRALPSCPDRAAAALEGFHCRYPSVPLGVLASGRELKLLHALGLAGLRHLVLREECGARTLGRFTRTLLAEDAGSRVIQALAPVVGRQELVVVRRAMDWSHRHLDADEFAAAFGVSRPHLSRRLRAHGLPSTGQLLRWALLFHAGHWLPDPGRSGESVGRQLEYANGSTFRRALRNQLDLTPTELSDAGLPRVIDAFVNQTGLDLSVVRRVA